MVAQGDRPARSSCASRFDQKRVETRRLQSERHVERIHRLGPRLVFELLDEIARHHGLDADLDRRLARYAALDPAILRAVSADRFAPLPLHTVESDG